MAKAQLTTLVMHHEEVTRLEDELHLLMVQHHEVHNLVLVISLKYLVQRSHLEDPAMLVNKVPPHLAHQPIVHKRFKVIQQEIQPLHQEELMPSRMLTCQLLSTILMVW